MKYILLCIPISLFTSCSMNGTDMRDTRITELEKQVQELKIENANLKENQVLMNA
jgi:ribosomal protein L29